MKKSVEKINTLSKSILELNNKIISSCVVLLKRCLDTLDKEYIYFQDYGVNETIYQGIDYSVKLYALRKDSNGIRIIDNNGLDVDLNKINIDILVNASISLFKNVKK